MVRSFNCLRLMPMCLVALVLSVIPFAAANASSSVVAVKGTPKAQLDTVTTTADAMTGYTASVEYLFVVNSVTCDVAYTLMPDQDAGGSSPVEIEVTGLISDSVTSNPPGNPINVITITYHYHAIITYRPVNNMGSNIVTTADSNTLTRP